MKKLIYFVLIVLMVCCLCACSAEENVDQKNDTLPPSVEVHIWTDEETGVQYIIYEGYKQGGIHPRLSADGNLYINHSTEKGR